jgi:hypothetical protein
MRASNHKSYFGRNIWTKKGYEPNSKVWCNNDGFPILGHNLRKKTSHLIPKFYFYGSKSIHRALHYDSPFIKYL